MENKKTGAMLGNGSWSTALVKIISENKDININWWVRSADDIPYFEKHGRNPRYLSSAKLDMSRIRMMDNLKEAVKEADYIFVVIPSAFVCQVLSQLESSDFKNKKVVVSIKGMIPDKHCTVSEYICSEFGVSKVNSAIVAGPCHAEEVAMERLSYLTVASENMDFAKEFAEVIDCRYINTNICQDMYGVEYCAVMKNIFAVACGIAHGLNFGDNFQAVLVSNGTREVKRYLDKVFPLEREMIETAYLGDILVTTYSQFSRNRTFGNMVGRGYSVKSAQMEMEMIAEGYYAVKSIYESNKEFGVKMPITTAVYNILYEKISPFVEFAILSEKLV
jgi:glycerol-3-phosphate dehydrogenase (NAD(P)+)